MPRETVRIRVAHADVGSSQRIHYTTLVRILEEAENALKRAVGLPCTTTLLRYAFPRVHVPAVPIRQVECNREPLPSVSAVVGAVLRLAV